MAWERTKPPPGAQVNRSHPLARGLVGCWLLNEGAGLPVDIINMRLATSVSNFNWAANSDGIGLAYASTSGIINVGNSPIYNPAGAITCAALVTMNPTLSAVANKVLCREQVSSPFSSYSLAGANSGGQWAFGVANSTTNVTANSGVIPAAGARYFLVGTYDGANIRIYVNGVLRGTTAQTGSILQSTVATAIGNSVSFSSAAQCTISAAWLHSRALLPQEVAAWYPLPYQMVIPPFMARRNLRLLGAVLSESLGLSDARKITAMRALSDSLTYTDARALIQNKYIAESWALSDARTTSATKGAAESLALSDARAQSFSKQAAEFWALSESRYAALQKQIADILGLSDSLVASISHAFVVMLAEVHALSDARANAPGKSVADTWALQDARAQSLAKQVADALAYGDTSGRNTLKGFADTWALSDARAAQTGKALAELYGITDALARRIGKVLAEPLGIEDTLIAGTFGIILLGGLEPALRLFGGVDSDPVRLMGGLE